MLYTRHALVKKSPECISNLTLSNVMVVAQRNVININADIRIHKIGWYIHACTPTPYLYTPACHTHSACHAHSARYAHSAHSAHSAHYTYNARYTYSA